MQYIIPKPLQSRMLTKSFSLVFLEEYEFTPLLPITQRPPVPFKGGECLKSKICFLFCCFYKWEGSKSPNIELVEYKIPILVF